MEKLVLSNLDRYQSLKSGRNYLLAEKAKIDFRIHKMTLPKSPAFSADAIKGNGKPLESRMIEAISDAHDLAQQIKAIDREIAEIDGIIDGFSDPAKAYADKHFRKGVSWQDVAMEAGKSIGSVRYAIDRDIAEYVKGRYSA